MRLKSVKADPLNYDRYRAILASFFLNERLGKIGRAGCSLCLVGSIIIVLHAPEDKEITTVDEMLGYALQPGELVQSCIFSYVTWL